MAILVAVSISALGVMSTFTEPTALHISPPENMSNNDSAAPADPTDLQIHPTNNDSAAPTEYAGPQIPQQVASSNNAFAIDMYKQIITDPAHKDAGIFFSPFSLYTAASFLYEGARGETASQMQHVFGFEPDESARHALMYDVSSSRGCNTG